MMCEQVDPQRIIPRISRLRQNNLLGTVLCGVPCIETSPSEIIRVHTGAESVALQQEKEDQRTTMDGSTDKDLPSEQRNA